MKQTLLFLFLFFACSRTFSQIYKGQWLAGGSGSFSHKSGSDGFNNNFNSNEFTIQPDGGYFIINNLAIGGRLGYDHANQKTGNLDSFFSPTRSTVLSASPFVRYYFLPAKKRVNILADASYNWDWYRTKYNPFIVKTQDQSFTVAAGPVFFLSPYSALELTLSYTHLPHKNYYYNDDVSVNIGFQVHIGKQKKKSS